MRHRDYMFSKKGQRVHQVYGPRRHPRSIKPSHVSIGLEILTHNQCETIQQNRPILILALSLSLSEVFGYVLDESTTGDRRPATGRRALGLDLCNRTFRTYVFCLVPAGRCAHLNGGQSSTIIS